MIFRQGENAMSQEIKQSLKELDTKLDHLRDCL
jgi:hypothetical protein